MEYTEDQLKAALVRALLDSLIEDYVAEFDHQGVWWRDTGKEVTTREWPYIVGMVEDKLTERQWMEYLDNLGSILPNARLKRYTSAKWHIRAQSLVNIGVLKIQ